MGITGIDHIVVNVADPRRALAFYVDVLGLEPVRLEEWERGDAPFVSVRVSETCIIDLMEIDRSGENIDHVCLVLDGGLDELIGRHGIEVEAGPMELYGARGQGRAVYVRDPDGNRIELREYP